MTTMRGGLPAYARFASRFVGTVVMLLALGSGCDTTGTGGWNQPATTSGERWTINCLRSSAPNHVELCNGLAELLRRTGGLDPKAVRVQSDGLASTIYYGEYTRVAGADEQLVFPPKMQKDIETVRRVAYNQTQPFSLASPEMLSGTAAGGQDQGQFHVTKAFNSKGEHTLSLLIAVFYNTPTFNQRREAADQYVQQLRSEGVEAYVFHEQWKSYVLVGSFAQNALVPLPGGGWGISKEVRDFMSSRPQEEFSTLTENGYRQKRVGPDGKAAFVPSQLVQVPEPGATSLYGR